MNDSANDTLTVGVPAARGATTFTSDMAPHVLRIVRRAMRVGTTPAAQAIRAAVGRAGSNGSDEEARQRLVARRMTAILTERFSFPPRSAHLDTVRGR